MKGSLQSKSLKQGSVEGESRNKVTIAKTGVKLESEEDKEHGKRELNRTSMPESRIGNSIAKAHKLSKKKVIAASFGRVV